MTKERCEFTAIRFDNGELVQGYYWAYPDGRKHFIRCPRTGSDAEVDHITIEPVAVAVQNVQDCSDVLHPNRKRGLCPNCGSGLKTNNEQRYCGWCGQRLDWRI